MCVDGNVVTTENSAISDCSLKLQRPFKNTSDCLVLRQGAGGSFFLFPSVSGCRLLLRRGKILHKAALLKLSSGGGAEVLGGIHTGFDYNSLFVLLRSCWFI